MEAPSARTLQRLAEETGYRADVLEKVLRLMDLLQEASTRPPVTVTARHNASGGRPGRDGGKA